jgi:hypothetical protein
MARISAALAVPAEAGNQHSQKSLQVNNSRSFPIPFANVPTLPSRFRSASSVAQARSMQSKVEQYGS